MATDACEDGYGGFLSGGAVWNVIASASRQQCKGVNTLAELDSLSAAVTVEDLSDECEGRYVVGRFF